jgi:(p)ppGpp synthase/HD superfamily hydrolase
LDDHGDPVRYFEHVRQVAIVLIDKAKIVKSEMIISALLHDVAEDAPNLPPVLIERCFGTDVIEIIKTLNKVPEEGYFECFNMSTDWRPFIKARDRLDNLRTLGAASKEFRVKQVAETREKYFPLFDVMMTLTPAPISITPRRCVTWSEPRRRNKCCY